MTGTEPFAWPPFVARENAFTPQEMDAVEALGATLTLEAGKVVYSEDAPESASHIRVTRTAWIEQTGGTEWLYARMAELALDINAANYIFDLRSFSERFQFAEYRAAEGGHHDWHNDQDAGMLPRKLSLSLQVSDGADYEGCDLQFHGGNGIETAPRGRGTVIAFPSYVIHQVTPVISGTRKAIVAWFSGPRFR